ncbi:Tic22 family protein [Tolypothrix sp. VBCCA 56010]|uniref:Tic22 family protein n=1 Tax=Tolypothrix sp. VBCCA 56010 TaxID=3137731 RepID=UPI003D7ED3A7
MKSLVRWGATLGLIGSTLLSTVFVGNVPVLALTQQQVKEKLDSVPVFLIMNNQDIPLTSSVPAGQNGQKPGFVTQVFMSAQEAQAFMNQLRNRKDPDPKIAEIVKTLQVKAVPLGVIYQKVKETANSPDRLLFTFQPGKQELEGAVALLNQSGQKVKRFLSVPVFIVNSPDKGYILMKRRSDNKDIFPLFLSKKDAQNLLNQVKSEVPKAEIQVVDMDGIIKALQEKNDQWLNQVALIPSSESIEYISKLMGNNPPNRSAAPAQNQSPSVPAKKK